MNLILFLIFTITPSWGNSSLIHTPERTKPIDRSPSHVEHWILKNDSSCQSFVKLLDSTELPNLEQLTTRCSGKAIAAILTHPRNRVHFLRSEYPIGDLGAAYLAKSFENPNNKLWALELENNQITPRGVEILSQIFTIEHNSLRALNLSENGVGTYGAAALAESFSYKGNRLISLRLTDSQIGEQGKSLLSDVFHRPTSSLIQLIIDQQCLQVDPKEKALDRLSAILEEKLNPSWTEYFGWKSGVSLACITGSICYYLTR